MYLQPSSSVYAFKTGRTVCIQEMAVEMDKYLMYCKCAEPDTIETGWLSNTLILYSVVWWRKMDRRPIFTYVCLLSGSGAEHILHYNWSVGRSHCFSTYLALQNELHPLQSSISRSHYSRMFKHGRLSDMGGWLCFKMGAQTWKDVNNVIRTSFLHFYTHFLGWVKKDPPALV